MENSAKEVGMMSLWSWHKPDFCLTKGRVDHKRSHYYMNHRGVPKSYKELSKKFIKQFKLEPERADQWVWCYTVPDAEKDTTKVEWQLEVPEVRVLAKVCSAVWHCIVSCNGEERGAVGTPPKEFLDLWKRKASRSRLKWEDLNRKFYNFWYSKTNEELWDALFLDKVYGECTTVLLRHPVEDKWVKTAKSKDDQK